MFSYWGRYSISGTPDRVKIQQAYDDLFNSPPWIVGIDTENVSIEDTTMLGFAIATPLNDNFYFRWPDDIQHIPWHLIQTSPIRKCYHNAPFDLGRNNLGKYNADINNIEDSAIITRLLNIPTTLSDVCDSVGIHTWSVKHLFSQYSLEIGKRVTKMTQLPEEWIAQKCCRDAQATLQLYLQKRRLVSSEYYQVERDITSLLLHMSQRGILLDQELVER